MVALYVTSPAGIRFPRTPENVAAFERSDVAAQEEEPKNVEVDVEFEKGLEAGEHTQVDVEGIDEREAGELTQVFEVEVEVDVKMKMCCDEVDVKMRLNVLDEREAGELTQGLGAGESTQGVEQSTGTDCSGSWIEVMGFADAADIQAAVSDSSLVGWDEWIGADAIGNMWKVRGMKDLAEADCLDIGFSTLLSRKMHVSAIGDALVSCDDGLNEGMIGRLNVSGLVADDSDLSAVGLNCDSTSLRFIVDDQIWNTIVGHAQNERAQLTGDRIDQLEVSADSSDLSAAGLDLNEAKEDSVCGYRSLLLCDEFKAAIADRTQNEGAPLPADAIGRLMVRRVILGDSDVADGSVSNATSLQFVTGIYSDATVADIVKNERALINEKIGQIFVCRGDILSDLRLSFQSSADNFLVSVDSEAGWKPKFSIEDCLSSWGLLVCSAFASVLSASISVVVARKTRLTVRISSS